MEKDKESISESMLLAALRMNTEKLANVKGYDRTDVCIRRNKAVVFLWRYKDDGNGGVLIDYKIRCCELHRLEQFIEQINQMTKDGKSETNHQG